MGHNNLYILTFLFVRLLRYKNCVAQGCASVALSRMLVATVASYAPVSTPLRRTKFLRYNAQIIVSHS